MSEDDKKIAIAAAVGLGIVVLIFLIFRGNSAAAPASDTTSPNLTPDLGTPSYTNYNVPAYSPDLGSIIPPSQQSAWGQPGPEACGCNTGGCMDGTPGMVGTVAQFNAMIGSYNP